MENITVTSWQLPLASGLSASATRGRAASALATLEVQGIAARPLAPNAALVASAACAEVAFDGTAVTTAKRDRNTGMGHTGITAVYVPGSLAWSPPI